MERPHAVWLYGSAARGDRDALSDLDVLLISNDSNDDQLVELPPESVLSRYNWNEFEVLAESGSLFLHHLRLEGRLIGGDPEGRMRSVKLVRHVGPYRLYRRDIAGFFQVLSDVVSAEQYGSTPEYELGVLATLTRHSAILASYLNGQPCFSRQTVFEVACGGLGLVPSDADRLRDLYAYRMVLEGRSTKTLPAEWADVREAATLVSDFLNRLEDAADAYELSNSEADS